MAHKYLKHAGLAALLLGCSVGLAQGAGQTTPPDPALLSPAPKPPTGAQTGVTGGGKVGNTPGAPIVAGWNYISHCNANQWYYDGTNWWEYNYNDDGTFWYYVINSPLEASGANQLKNACEHGSYWIYVTNTSTGAYSHIWIYDHLN